MKYYVIKNGRTVSDFDDIVEAKACAEIIGGEIATEIMKGCNNEFPYFGASYPDACCIDGYLWDMDSHEEGLGFTSGGDDPCPFCNEEEWLENVVESIFDTKEEALAWRDAVAKRWGCKI